MAENTKLISVLYEDILKQPHTLIAGATGSGKSCAINGILYTLMVAKGPWDASLILIDPKLTELAVYKDLPHTVAYSTKPDVAVKVLKECITMIEKRYSRAVERGLKTSDEPDVYIVIDELSDLIYSDREAVGLLGKIARIGRAANVHLIAATQCPNRETLSAEFAANCPARLGLRCTDAIESRQIIGTDAAVNLPMYGEAYYRCPQKREPEHVKLWYYTDEELTAYVKRWIDAVAQK